jgi:hypothetical protein
LEVLFHATGPIVIGPVKEVAYWDQKNVAEKTIHLVASTGQRGRSGVYNLTTPFKVMFPMIKYPH